MLREYRPLNSHVEGRRPYSDVLSYREKGKQEKMDFQQSADCATSCCELNEHLEIRVEPEL